MPKLNFTGRKRINRERIELRQRDGTPSPVFDCRLQISDMTLPGDADIFVEAYRQFTHMRFHAGTAADVRPLVGKELAEFGSPEGITYRIKVVVTQGPSQGLLLAKADGLTPDAPTEATERGSLLPFIPSDQMGDRIWSLDLGGERPCVYINSSIGDWQQLARQQEFSALVYPEIAQQVLYWLLGQLDQRPDSAIIDEWCTFFEQLGVSPYDAPDGDTPEGRDWLDEAVAKFCRRHGFSHLVAASLEADLGASE